MIYSSLFKVEGLQAFFLEGKSLPLLIPIPQKEIIIINSSLSLKRKLSSTPFPLPEKRSHYPQSFFSREDRNPLYSSP